MEDELLALALSCHVLQRSSVYLGVNWLFICTSEPVQKRWKESSLRRICG